MTLVLMQSVKHFTLIYLTFNESQTNANQLLLKTKLMPYEQNLQLIPKLCNKLYSFSKLATSAVNLTLLSILSIIQSVSQSVSQSISQSLSQSINQSVSQSVNLSVYQPFTQSLTESISQSVSQSVNQSVSYPTTRSVDVSFPSPCLRLL